MNNSTYKLKDICKIKSGKRIPLGMDFNVEETPYPYIRARDIKGGKIQTDDLIYLDKDVHDKIKRYIINSGDIAITIVGASVGDVSYAQAEVDGYNLTENAVRLTGFDELVNSKYLFYILSQPQYREYMQIVAGGAAQPKLGIYKVEKIKVQLPNIDVQNNISEILSQYDLAVENNNKRIKILEQMAENLYKEWFVRFRFPGHEDAKFEHGIPNNWRYRRADEMISFNPSLGINGQNEFTIIPMEALSNSSMVIDSNCFIVQDRITGRRSQNGDTLFAKITPCLENGKTGYVMGLKDGEIAGGSTEFIVLRSKTLNEYYVYFVARSHYFRQTAILSMNGADGRQRVSEDKLKSTKLIQPTKEILNHFKEVVEPIFLEVRKIIQENENLIRQRDLLLPRLMSGKLQVK